MNSFSKLLLDVELIFNSLDNYLLEDFCSFDYNREYSCEASGCDSICRCAVITDISFQKFDYPNFWSHLLEVINWNKYPDYYKFLLDRYFKAEKIYNSDYWEGEGVGDYYGEIFRVNISQSLYDSLYQDVKIIKNYSDLEIIKFLLHKEYQKSLPEVERATEFYFDTLPINKIIFSNPNHLEKCKLESFYQEYQYTTGIVILHQKHHLIDGYHRLAQAIKDNKNTAEFLVLK